MTVGRPSVGMGIDGSSSIDFPFPLLSVERLLTGRLGAFLLSRLSVLPCAERGGVIGEGRY